MVGLPNRIERPRKGMESLGSLSNFLEQVSLFNPIRKVGDNAVHSHLAGAGNVRRFIDRVCKDLEIGVVQGLYKGSGQATEGQADMSGLRVDGKRRWMDRNRLQERHGLRTRMGL